MQLSSFLLRRDAGSLVSAIQSMHGVVGLGQHEVDLLDCNADLQSGDCHAEIQSKLRMLATSQTIVDGVDRLFPCLLTMEGACAT